MDHGVGMVGGQVQTEDAAEAKAADNHRIAFLLKLLEGDLDAAIPVLPAGLCKILPGSAVPGDLGTMHRISVMPEADGDGPHLERGSA